MSVQLLEAFGPDLRVRLAANLAAHEREAHPLDGRMQAAVAVVIVDSDADAYGGDEQAAGGPAVLLTRRAPR
ncbi:MAG: hypothetical protein J2P57_25290, partial [Acidimicrobiaceae bacterium]|nr:hypothetical protein [Acidimicrobiaceae bacterium]